MADTSDNPSWRNAGVVFRFVWVSAGATLLMLIWHLLMPGRDASGIVMGVAAGGMIQCLFAAKMDQYYRALYAVGQSFLTAYAALCLVAFWFLGTVDEGGRIATALRPWLADGYLIAICGAVVFYAGYAVAWLRDRF